MDLRSEIEGILNLHINIWGGEPDKQTKEMTEQILEAFKKKLTEEELKSAMLQEANHGDGTGKVKADYEQVFKNLLEGLENGKNKH